MIVRPETVIRWHRTGFKQYWKWISRHRTCADRSCVSRELRELIFRMVCSPACHASRWMITRPNRGLLSMDDTAWARLQVPGTNRKRST